MQLFWSHRLFNSLFLPFKETFHWKVALFSQRFPLLRFSSLSFLLPQKICHLPQQNNLSSSAHGRLSLVPSGFRPPFSSPTRKYPCITQHFWATPIQNSGDFSIGRGWIRPWATPIQENGYLPIGVGSPLPPQLFIYFVRLIISVDISYDAKI